MENLLLRAPSTSTPTLPPTFQIQLSFFAVGFTTRTTFLRNRTESTPHLCCRTKHSPSKAFPTKQEFFLLQQQVEEDDQEIDDDTSFLSLSVKPDRNLGLLDDYETEELGYDCGPNHKSGLFSNSFTLLPLNKLVFLQWKLVVSNMFWYFYKVNKIFVTYMNLLTNIILLDMTCSLLISRYSLGVML